MSGRRQTSGQLSPSDCGGSFTAQITSNDWSYRELINGVLVYFDQSVPQSTSCLWHPGDSLQQKYWHTESAGNEATTQGINPLWHALPPGFWFTRTIHTATTSGRSPVCPSCGSLLAEAKKCSGLIRALSEKESLFAFTVSQARRDCSRSVTSICLSDLIYLVALVMDFFFLTHSSRCKQSQESDLLENLLPTVLVETWDLYFLWFFSSSQRSPKCDTDPVCRFMWSRPPRWDDWASLSLTHCETFPLWLQSTAFTQPKYQTMCPNGKCRHTWKKPLQWRASFVPVSIYYTNMATQYHIKRLSQVIVKTLPPRPSFLDEERFSGSLNYSDSFSLIPFFGFKKRFTKSCNYQSKHRSSKSRNLCMSLLENRLFGAFRSWRLHCWELK